MIEILPIGGIGEIAAGDDLGVLLAEALAPLRPEPGNILAVTHKVVSKAQGRSIALAEVEPGARALELAARLGKDPRLVELALRDSTEVIRAERGVLITRHQLGLVMANAGIDSSNAGPAQDEQALLLPLDPDGAAAEIATVLAQRLGVELGVVIADSFGRPWRHGVVNVAIGCAGVPALVDKRGEPDRDGRVLQATLIATGDLIASAAGLVMGEAAEGIPAALIRGLAFSAPPRPASALVRPAAEDLFR